MIKLARKLHNKKYRDQEQMFLVEGRRSVEEALARPELVYALFIEEGLQEEYANTEISDVYVLDARLLKQVCTTETPQGMAAILRKPAWSYADLLAAQGLIVLMDRIADPGNMGSMIRTCWALGAEGILLTPGCVDPYSPKVVRSTMGGILNLPLFDMISEPEINLLKQQGYRFIGTSLDDALNYYAADLTGAQVLIMGNEAEGISPKLKKSCDSLVKIPMNPMIDSLNVAAACAIMMAEAWRQRNGRSIKQ